MTDCEWLTWQMSQARWQRRNRRRLSLRTRVARLIPLAAQHRRGRSAA